MLTRNEAREDSPTPSALKTSPETTAQVLSFRHRIASISTFVTRAQFLAKCPNAKEQVIRLNCTDFGGDEHDRRPAGTDVGGVTSHPSRRPKPKAKRQLVPRTRNAGTWTNAEFWGRLRSCLRRMSIYWKPARLALLAARVPFHGPRGQKWAFLCADCQRLFKRSVVQLDHVVPCGQLTDYAHIGAFLERLLPEDPKAYRIRCTKCHQAKTNAERIKAPDAPRNAVRSDL